MSTNGYAPVPHAPPDFLSQYVYLTSGREVPRQFDLWTAIAALGACLGKRCWVQHTLTERVYANLYVLLIGNSGAGKNIAIDFAQDLLAPFAHQVGLYRGEVTKQGLIDYMGTKCMVGTPMEAVPPSRPFFLLAPELRDCFGEPMVAKQLITYLTERYTAVTKTFQESKRLAGVTVVKEPCISLLAGSTKEWLIATVPRDSLEGGFLGRCVPVFGKRRTDLRIAFPQPPADFDQGFAYLRSRLEDLLASCQGPFVLTPEAREAYSYWYNHRAAPLHEDEEPMWLRQPGLVLKLALIQSVAEAPGPHQITRPQLERALLLAKTPLDNAPDLMDFASLNRTTLCTYVLERLVAKAGRIDKSVAHRRLGKRFDARRVNEAIASLKLQEKIVLEFEGPKQRTVLVWVAPFQPPGLGGEGIEPL